MTKEEKIPFPDTQHLTATEAAEQWFTYNQSGLVTAEAAQAFSVWRCQSPANEQAYIDAGQMWQDLGFALLQNAPEEKIETPSAQAEAKRKLSYGKEWLWGMAATVLIGFGSIHLASDSASTEFSASYASQIGEIKTLTLEDNSTVTLSADSELNIHFTAEKRELQLLKGRAYFEVAPDKSRPFIVSAGYASATAVGTAFDVNNTADGVDVVVTHGIVDVRGYRDAEHTLYRDKEQLFAGQQIHSAINGTLDEPETVNQQDALSWRNGRLVFEGETLAVVTEEINRYRNKKIRLADKELKQRRITLSVPTEKTDSLIGAINASEKVNISETDSEVVISLIR